MWSRANGAFWSVVGQHPSVMEVTVMGSNPVGNLFFCGFLFKTAIAPRPNSMFEMKVVDFEYIPRDCEREARAVLYIFSPASADAKGAEGPL